MTHASITENKHPSAVLARVKEERDKAAPPPKVKSASAKNGYNKTGRHPPAKTALKDGKYYERLRDERAAEDTQ